MPTERSFEESLARLDELAYRPSRLLAREDGSTERPGATEPRCAAALCPTTSVYEEGRDAAAPSTASGGAVASTARGRRRAPSSKVTPASAGDEPSPPSKNAASGSHPGAARLAPSPVRFPTSQVERFPAILGDAPVQCRLAEAKCAPSAGGLDWFAQFAYRDPCAAD